MLKQRMKMVVIVAVDEEKLKGTNDFTLLKFSILPMKKNIRQCPKNIDLNCADVFFSLIGMSLYPCREKFLLTKFSFVGISTFFRHILLCW